MAPRVDNDSIAAVGAVVHGGDLGCCCRGCLGRIFFRGSRQTDLNTLHDVRRCVDGSEGVEVGTGS